MFYVCGGVAGVGGLLYLIMADGELQPWAVPRDTSHDGSGGKSDVRGEIEEGKEQEELRTLKPSQVESS